MSSAPAAAGVQILPAGVPRGGESFSSSPTSMPFRPGIEGLALQDYGKELPGGSLGIGPLAIGDIKYKTESGLFQRMAASNKPLCLDFREAFMLARELV